MNLYPCLKGSYLKTLGIPEMWTNSLERDQAYQEATLLSVVFAIFAFMLAASIIQVIRTNPGNIPEDKEWDMLTDSLAESSVSEEGESAIVRRVSRNRDGGLIQYNDISRLLIASK